MGSRDASKSISGKRCEWKECDSLHELTSRENDEEVGADGNDDLFLGAQRRGTSDPFAVLHGEDGKVCLLPHGGNGGVKGTRSI